MIFVGVLAFVLGASWGALIRDVSRWLRSSKQKPTTRIVAAVPNRRALEVAELADSKNATVIMADSNLGWIQPGAAGRC